MPHWLEQNRAILAILGLQRAFEEPHHLGLVGKAAPHIDLLHLLELFGCQKAQTCVVDQ